MCATLWCSWLLKFGLEKQRKKLDRDDWGAVLYLTCFHRRLHRRRRRLEKVSRASTPSSMPSFTLSPPSSMCACDWEKERCAAVQSSSTQQHRTNLAARIMLPVFADSSWPLGIGEDPKLLCYMLPNYLVIYNSNYFRVYISINRTIEPLLWPN